MQRRIVAVAGVLWLTAAMATAQSRPDNTAANKNDRGTTADQQKNGRTDVETTREIRKAIVADKSLSTYAHNIKIVTRDGKVDLRGPVRSASEKDAVTAKATEVAGAGNVTAEVTVVPEKTKK